MNVALGHQIAVKSNTPIVIRTVRRAGGGAQGLLGEREGNAPEASSMVFLRAEPASEVKMSAPSSQKVVLKSTTKVSLNERFTNMLKNKQPAAVSIRATMQQQHLASARNRRLAQQMENRPSVQAALNHKQSLKQRLGKSNIQARLGRPVGALMRGGAPGGRGGMRGMNRGGLRGRARGGIMRGALSLRGKRVASTGGPMRGRGSAGRLAMRRAGRRGGLRGRGGFAGRGGRGRGRGVDRQSVTREQLDNQLDAYMSKTKGHLDAELDAYMAQADPDSME
ncbi:hypothetical protein F7725_025654 [Dissostichus mawsoni]|uniref:Chromatin target of PRMT1 protein C-terminal domain-containing protein n=1 Tax=Dissostichus mawsoni TaxID=36200 RepID=A0A7J5XBT2_DISMA|nr:hypothetical protein F7725_025654 [Dissostichus mawsoni]